MFLTDQILKWYFDQSSIPFNISDLSSSVEGKPRIRKVNETGVSFFESGYLLSSVITNYLKEDSNLSKMSEKFHFLIQGRREIVIEDSILEENWNLLYSSLSKLGKSEINSLLSEEVKSKIISKDSKSIVFFLFNFYKYFSNLKNTENSPTSKNKNKTSKLISKSPKRKEKEDKVTKNIEKSIKSSTVYSTKIRNIKEDNVKFNKSNSPSSKMRSRKNRNKRNRNSRIRTKKDIPVEILTPNNKNKKINKDINIDMKTIVPVKSKKRTPENKIKQKNINNKKVTVAVPVSINKSKKFSNISNIEKKLRLDLERLKTMKEKQKNLRVAVSNTSNTSNTNNNTPSKTKIIINSSSENISCSKSNKVKKNLSIPLVEKEKKNESVYETTLILPSFSDREVLFFYEFCDGTKSKIEKFQTTTFSRRKRSSSSSSSSSSRSSSFGGKRKKKKATIEIGWYVEDFGIGRNKVSLRKINCLEYPIDPEMDAGKRIRASLNFLVPLSVDKKKKKNEVSNENQNSNQNQNQNQNQKIPRKLRVFGQDLFQVYYVDPSKLPVSKFEKPETSRRINEDELLSDDLISRYLNLLYYEVIPSLDSHLPDREILLDVLSEIQNFTGLEGSFIGGTRSHKFNNKLRKLKVLVTRILEHLMMNYKYYNLHELETVRGLLSFQDLENLYAFIKFQKKISLVLKESKPDLFKSREFQFEVISERVEKLLILFRKVELFVSKKVK